MDIEHIHHHLRLHRRPRHLHHHLHHLLRNIPAPLQRLHHLSLLRRPPNHHHNNISNLVSPARPPIHPHSILHHVHQTQIDQSIRINLPRLKTINVTIATQPVTIHRQTKPIRTRATVAMHMDATQTPTTHIRVIIIQVNLLQGTPTSIHPIQALLISMPPITSIHHTTINTIRSQTIRRLSIRIIIRMAPKTFSLF